VLPKASVPVVGLAGTPEEPIVVSPVKVGDSVMSPTTAPVEGVKVRLPEEPGVIEVTPPPPPEALITGFVAVPVMVIPVPAVIVETQFVLSTI
jgi:hypothetical protein